ncbi:MAG TPA: methyltransferase domain-containing protein [Herpetosiphonaceae bacterium]
MTQTPRPSFFRAWLDAPFVTGGIQPSSPWLVSAMVNSVRVRTAKVVVELGAGTGAITRAILAALGPEGRLISFETNPDFVEWLKQDIRDPRLQLIPQSAATLRSVLDSLEIPLVDCILSGVPLQALPPPVTQQILEDVRASMGPRSQFVAFQYTPKQEAVLRRHFPVVQLVRRVWLNIPPSRVYRCELGPEAAGR